MICPVCGGEPESRVEKIWCPDCNVEYPASILEMPLSYRASKRAFWRELERLAFESGLKRAAKWISKHNEIKK